MTNKNPLFSGFFVCPKIAKSDYKRKGAKSQNRKKQANIKKYK